MNASSVLVAAREMLANPENWIRGRSRSADGKHCMVDALWKASGASEAMATLAEAIGGGSISAWNDAEGRTHAEVMAAFDRAIAFYRE